MWTKVENYEYSTIQEGPVDIKVAPATDLDAQLLTVRATCVHYEWHGKVQARFELDLPKHKYPQYLDLADYVVLYWKPHD